MKNLLILVVLVGAIYLFVQWQNSHKPAPVVQATPAPAEPVRPRATAVTSLKAVSLNDRPGARATAAAKGTPYVNPLNRPHH